MKRLLAFALSLGLVAALAVPALAVDKTVKLLAGQTMVAGEVKISGAYTVEITLNDGWCMTEAHVAQAQDLAGLPQNRAGNPKIGQFEENETYQPCVMGDTFTFPSDGGSVFAVHAVVAKTVVAGPSWATKVVSSDQGLRKNGSPVPDARSNPQEALVADYVTNGAITFFSLGKDGEIVVGFDCKVLNKAGNDLKIWEVTNGPYPAERADVSVSKDGETWTGLGTATNAGSGSSRTSAFDADPLPWFKYVKLVDVTDFSQNFTGDPADGFDVDGVEALADCVKFETAWGEGTSFPGGSWAMYIELK